jgi:hypothetical protein
MPLISVFTDQIRMDRLNRYQERIGELAAEARKKKEAWHWAAHQVGFGDRAKMYYVSRHEDYADVEKHGDPQALFRRVLGDKKGEKQLEEVSESLVSSERALGVPRPDLSYPKQPTEGIAPISSLVVVRARPGRQHAIEEMLFKIAEAIPKTGESAHIASYQAVTGDMLVYWVARALDRLADLDRQSIGRDLLSKAYGEPEGERLYHSGLENAEQLIREINFYREDLSNPPS